MNPAFRSTTLAAIVAAGILLTACTPTAGSLGTPAIPVVSPAGSDEPTPSDVAPASPSATPIVAPSVSPSSEPSTASSTEPTESTAPATPTPAATRKPTPAPAGTTIVRAYFMLGSFTDNPGLAPVLREVPETKAVAMAAMTALLGGPQGAELEASPAMYTSIPEGTRVLDLDIANGLATVRLSRQFQDAQATFQVLPATAQVVYTLTQFSTVDEVRIEVDGEGSLGRSDRSDFQVEGILPAIFVDRPAWGAAAGNPARISGIANVFEATFQAQLLDARGKVIAEDTVMATCGTGCWGTFRTDLDYEVGRAQYGTLRVYEPSARDGKPVNVTEYRVWLTP